MQSFAGSRRNISLSEELTATVKALSRREEVSLFMLLLAAFNATLHCHTGEIDILVGSPVASRNQAELENLIGLFLNNLLLRTNLAGDPTFRELLVQIRNVSLDAYAHQTYLGEVSRGAEAGTKLESESVL